VKSEAGERFESYAHAKEALFDYIEVFYNQRRRHSTLGQISPAAFERQAAMDAAGAVDAQNAPTAPWKTAENAVSHSAHPHHRYSLKNDRTKSDQLSQPVH
jgi:Integrase core domain